MKRLWIPLAALLVATPVTAQMNHGDAASLAGIKTLNDLVSKFIVTAAEQMTEANYAYKPTAEVRSFGEVLGHIANSGYAFCAGATGEKPPTMPNAEKLATKAEIVSALKVTFAYCDKAYMMEAARLGEKLDFFGQSHTRLSVLAFNMGHNFEHYGNIVTYMRLKGMVPPSSQQGGN